MRRIRWYPHTMLRHIREELASIKAQGIIRDSVSSFNSALWTVHKKSLPGETEEVYRVMINYRKLS